MYSSMLWRKDGKEGGNDDDLTHMRVPYGSVAGVARWWGFSRAVSIKIQKLRYSECINSVILMRPFR